MNVRNGSFLFLIPHNIVISNVVRNLVSNDDIHYNEAECKFSLNLIKSSYNQPRIKIDQTRCRAGAVWRNRLSLSR